MRGSNFLQHSGRALANANATSATDGSNTFNDDDDERVAAAGSPLRPGLRPRRATRPGSVSAMARFRAREGLNAARNSPMMLLSATFDGVAQSKRTITTSGTSAQASKAASMRGQMLILPSRLDTVIEDDAEGSALSTSPTRPTPPRRRLTTSAINDGEAPTGRAPSIQELESSMPLPSSVKEGKPSTSTTKTSTTTPPMYAELMGLHGGRFGPLHKAIEQFRRLPKSQLSTPSFNAALEGLIELRNRSPPGESRDGLTQDVIDTYVQMIDCDCAPDARSYSVVVQALCHRDEQGVADSFDQALGLADLAHSSSASGFPTVEPYNSLIRGCMLRGDATKASEIIGMLAKNPAAKADDKTIQQLILSHAKDESMDRQDRLAACNDIFDKCAKVAPVDSVWIWNALLKARFQLGDQAGAVSLVEEMLTAYAEDKGPRPNAATSSIVIGGLLDNDDVAGAAAWFDRISSPRLSGSSDPAWAEESAMPLPKLSTSTRLFLEFVETLESANLSALATKDALDFLPALQAANRAVQVCYDGLMEVDDASYKVSFRAFNSLIQLNMEMATRLNEGEPSSPAASEDLIDSSLSHLKAQYELMGDHAHGGKHRDRSVLDGATFWGPAHNVKTITSLVSHLVKTGRVQDGAAAFTYALFAMPTMPENARAIKDTHPMDSWKGVLRDINGNIKYILCGNSNLHFVEPIRDLSLPAEPVEHLAAGAEVMYDAVLQFDFAAHEWACQRIVQLYAAARADGEVSLSAKGWSNVVAAFVKAEELSPMADVQRMRSQFGPMFDDIGRLDDETRSQVALQNAFSILAKRYGLDEATSLVARADAEAAALMRESSDDASSSSIDSMAPTSATEPSTPMTTESMLRGYDAPEGLPSDKLSAVQSVDSTLDEHMLRIMSDGFPKGQRINQQLVTAAAYEAYGVMQRSIEETGTYPTPFAIVRLLDVFGRAGELAKIHEVYVVGCHIVSALGSDLAWQQQAWYDVENAMVAALAHGGDTKAASAHRHKVIQAGMVPSADSYAALIATVRDTTDDALVAEELFDESQRLGVQANTYLYNTVISQLSRARKAERALQLFDEVLAAQATGDRRCKATSITYGAVINACTRTGDEINAERLFEVMEASRGFTFQAPPYNTMIQFYTQTKPDREKALKYYQKMLTKQIKPTAHTYKLLLDVHGCLEPVQAEALDNVFGRLVADAKVPVQGTHWASLINAYGCHLHDMDKAVSIFEGIPRHFTTPKPQNGASPKVDSVAFEALLNVFLAHHRVDLMWEYAAKLSTMGLHPTAYVANLLIRGLSSQQGNNDEGIQRARAIFQQMRDPPMGVAAAGNHPPNHRQHANAPRQPEPESMSFETEPQQEPIETGEHDAHLAFFRGVLREPSTFEAMIRGEMACGETQRAMDLVQRMESRAYPPALVAKARALVAGDVKQTYV